MPSTEEIRKVLDQSGLDYERRGLEFTVIDRTISWLQLAPIVNSGAILALRKGKLVVA
jgi:hypothetical protein